MQRGVYIRPYAIECLKELNKVFEVAIFTAGLEEYAQPIIDLLDSEGVLVQHRYFKHHTN